MVAGILERGGARLVSNRAGANMAGGVASAMLHGHGDTGLFEVDEFWLDQVVAPLKPDALLLANLFRDQLDRYGELESIADRWAEVARAGLARRLVLNADDPLVADLGTVVPAGAEPLYFGVEDAGLALEGLQHAADSTHCRRCGAPYAYDAIFMGHLGHYHCPNGDSTRPAPQVTASDVVLAGITGASFTLAHAGRSARVELPLPGLYNVYNALGAAALTLALDAPFDDVVAGLHAVAPAFGRAETVTVRDRELLLLLVKNPAGCNEVLRTLVLEDGEHDLLCVLNDQTADGRDVSWIWDADFELLAGRVRRAVCAGSRAPEMALRLKYAGVREDRLVVEPSLPRALDRATDDGASPRVFALPTYTAMLALREELVGRGAAKGSFG
jgi:UDP-N-acetylmuramyl tripeptide synthase